MTSSAESRAFTPTLIFVAVVAVAMVTAEVALQAAGVQPLADLLYVALIAVGALACFARVALRRNRRVGWSLIGLGVAFWAAGEVAYVLAARAGEQAPAWTDLAYGGLYVFALGGVFAMFHGAMRPSLGLALDAVVGVFGVTTLWFWLVFSHHLEGTHEGTGADLLFPLLDLVAAVVALTLLSQNRWRPAPGAVAIGLGFLVAAIADSIYAVELVHGHEQTGPLLAGLWAAGALLLGLAAWLPAREPLGNPRPMPFLVTTTVSTAIAVTALIWGNFNDVHAKPILVTLAILTVLASMTRGVLLYVERQRALNWVRGEGMRSVHALAAAADARDRYTHDHSRRVAVYATAIAVRMGLSIDEIEELATAAELHDVGKIATPDAILLKPARLTDEEFAVIKRHSEEGERIVRAMGRSRIATWVRHHHERWDGNGYPDRIAGARIPLESRVLAAADALDAMTTDRSYSLAVSTEGAIDEIERSAGTQLDPAVAATLVALLRERVVRPPEGNRPLLYELAPETGGRLHTADYGRVLEILATLTSADGPRSHEIAFALPVAPPREPVPPVR